MNRQIFYNSVDAVRDGINKKLNYGTPYYARNNTVKNMITDMDNFPYVRYFRGQYDSEYPQIFDREAGWRLREDQCYRGLLAFKEQPYPNNCFEAPCSTVYPCVPKLSERPAFDVQLNRTCVLKSP